MRSVRSSTLSGSQLAWSKYIARRRLEAFGSASNAGIAPFTLICSTEMSVPIQRT
jgi:hypothetical protein